MIRSMTGFGRASVRSGELALDVEVRSVNHRYLDLRVRLPRLLSALEPELRARVQGRFARGKLDLGVTAPIVILSGMATPEDQEKALAAGADAYLDKDDVRQGALAAQIRELLG